MPIPYHPDRGEILICNFDDQAVGAEIIKRRPVVVISPRSAQHSSLCMVVPLSTTQPNPPRAWHHSLAHVRITGWQASAPMWAKCDLVSTVSFQRLNKPYVKLRSGRNYVTHKLSDQDLNAVIACLRAYLQI